jgi:hypothetical protein
MDLDRIKKTTTMIDQVIKDFNNAPQEDFMGLSPNQMHGLLYDPLGEKSSIHFRSIIEESTLDAIPLFRILEEYLLILRREKQIKLTPLGAMPMKVLVELYEKKILLDELIESGTYKLRKEQDCIHLASMRFSAELGGLVRKANGKLHLTKKAEKYMDKADRVQLFKDFFKAFVFKFAWSYNDGYEERVNMMAQSEWAYTVYMVHMMAGETKNMAFYAQKIIQAMPRLLDSFEEHTHSPAAESLQRCFSTRAFARFQDWFGFITILERSHFSEGGHIIKANDLVGKVFYFY